MPDGLSRCIVPPIASTRSLSPSKPRARGRVGSPDAVVANVDAKRAFACGHRDLHDRGAGVLGRVRERLRDDVVGRHLDRLRQAAVGATSSSTRNRRAARERLQRRLEPALGEDRRMDPERDLAEVVERVREPVDDVGQLARDAARAPRAAFACAARSSSASETSCCCAPSCRSRSIRRRVASAVATIRAREASSSARPSAFAIAVATSSVNFASRPPCRPAAARRSREPTAMTPQRRPSTTTARPPRTAASRRLAQRPRLGPRRPGVVDARREAGLGRPARSTLSPSSGPAPPDGAG